jgi:drug/metabolite transporter (DMT)-like permease
LGNETKGIALVAGATLFWSLSGVFVRWLPSVDPWTFNAWRGLGMGLALVVWTLLHYGRGAAALFLKADPVAIVTAAGFFAVGSSLYILAMQLASIAAVSCLGATSCLFAALLARFWLGEHTRPVFYLAIAVAMGGVVVIAMGESNASASGFAGSLAALGMALCFAGQSVALRRYKDLAMEPSLVAGGLGVFAAVALTVGLAPVAWSTLLTLLFMGALQLALPMVLFMRGARHVAAVQMVLITMADAFLNPLWVWMVHGELPATAVYGGGALILVAIGVTTLTGSRQPRLKAAD